MHSEAGFAAGQAAAREKPDLRKSKTPLGKALDIIDEYTPKLEDFISAKGYDPKIVDKHIKECEGLKAKFRNNQNEESKRTRVLAQLMEAIIFDQTEKNEWFGSELMTSLPSNYDDYINGTDIIVQRTNEDGEIEPFFAVDITFSKSLKKKFVRIADEINNDELTELLYYEDTNGTETIRRPVSNIPKIVIGVLPETLLEIATTWTKNDNRSLATHPIQTYLLEQAFAQLTSLSNYAGLTNHPDIQAKYKEILKVLTPVLKEKREKIGMGTLGNDPVLDNILSAIRDVTKIKQ